jgi:small-conductance mechanosensitive channel
MVFERPIQIGDTIEVDNTMGKVQGIGARSSTIKTFDGSEVIIPNADFISKEIINWTLSDQHRRKTVEFKVDLDNDIDMILKIMQEVAESHPDVLKDPKPLATLKSFGEYYLEFKLYFWLSENLIVAQSEVNISIYRALKDAGVTMPIPKTDIQHLQ